MATIYEVLRGEHAEVLTLLRELHDSDAPDAERRTTVLARVVEHIAAHSRAEQEVVYPQLAGAADDRMAQALDDHREIEAALRELVACDVHHELWIAKLELLRAAVETHVEREEVELFAALSKILAGDAAEQLGDEFARRRSVLRGRAA